MQRIRIKIERRHDFRAVVELKAKRQVAGLSLEEIVIGSDQDEGEMRLEAAQNATLGRRLLRVVAAAEGQEEESLLLQVVILPFDFDLDRENPDREKPSDGREMRYPSRMIRQIGKQRAVFVLIQPKGEDAPFYLMESKVSKGMFRAFVDKNAVANEGNVRDEDELPVFGLTQAEAEQFAERLGGHLPRARQLDWAFGYYDKLDEKDKLLNAAKKPQPRGPRKITEVSDLSPRGIRDLAGNGREWTRDTLAVDGREVAVLRGRSYLAPELVSWMDVHEWVKNPKMRPVQFPDHRSPTTSFRVVIELPKQPDDE